MTRPRPVERRRIERPVQRHVAERPLFEFDIMAKQLMDETQRTVTEHGLTLGVAKPKYKPKFADITKSISKKPLKQIMANTWLPMHPIKLSGEVISTKKGGLVKFRRDKKNAEKIEKLNEKYAPAVETMNRVYEAEVKAALQELIDAVGNGRVNERNGNQYFKEYKQKVQDAQTKFKNRANAVTQNFGKEFTGKWV